MIYKDVKIIDTNILGSGVAKIDGKVIFVKGAVKGDEADIEITSNKKNFCLAKINKINCPSEMRDAPDCPAFLAGCGSCSLRHVNYSHQLEIKLNAISAAARRVGAILPLPEKILTPYPNILRNKVVFHCQNGKFGYYKNGTNSLEFLPECGCPAAHSVFSEVVSVLENLLEDFSSIHITYLYMRCSSDGKNVIVTVGLSEPSSKTKMRELALALNAHHSSIIGVFFGVGSFPEDSDLIHVWGEEFLRSTVSGAVFDISPSSFWQVNSFGAELLTDAVSELLAPADTDYIADLCCGTGLFSIILAKKFPKTDFIGIELNPSAAKNAQHNASLNSLSNVKYFEGDCVEIAARSERQITAAILDPPRSGASASLLSEIAKLKIPRIVYVACSPEALARDSKILAKSGYHASRLLAVDLFANSSHVESILRFDLME